MSRLQGEHAFITGGGSGIGLACAHALHLDGARITLFGRNRDRLEAAIAALGALGGSGQARYSVGDVGAEASLAEAITTADRIAPLSIAVANAGKGGAAALLDTEDDDWQDIFRTNLSGTLYTIKHAGRAMRVHGGGAICAISSIAGLRTHRLMSAYCSSKAAVDMLVRNAADELGSHHIRVNSVCPGLVETDLSSGLHQHDAMRSDYLSCMPLGRTGQTEDVAAAVRFLCGPEASWITGANLPVDGGHHLRRGPDLGLLQPG